MAVLGDDRKLAGYYVGALRLLGAQARKGPRIQEEECAQIFSELHEDANDALLCHNKISPAQQERLQHVDALVRKVVNIFLWFDGEDWSSAVFEIENYVEEGLAQLEREFPGVQDDTLYGEFVDVSRLAKLSAVLPIQENEMDFVPEMMKLLIQALPSSMAAANTGSMASSTNSSSLWLPLSQINGANAEVDSLIHLGRHGSGEASSSSSPVDSLGIAKATLEAMADDEELQEEAVTGYASTLQKNKPELFKKLVAIAENVQAAAENNGHSGGDPGRPERDGPSAAAQVPGAKQESSLSKFWNWLCKVVCKSFGWLRSAFQSLWEKMVKKFKLLMFKARSVASCVANTIAQAGSFIYSIIIYSRLARSYSKVRVD